MYAVNKHMPIDTNKLNPWSTWSEEHQ